MCHFPADSFSLRLIRLSGGVNYQVTEVFHSRKALYLNFMNPDPGSDNQGVDDAKTDHRNVNIQNCIIFFKYRGDLTKNRIVGYTISATVFPLSGFFPGREPLNICLRINLEYPAPLNRVILN